MSARVDCAAAQKPACQGLSDKEILQALEQKRLRLDYLIDPSCRLYQDPKAFCLNSDTAALALFAPAVTGKKVLEIGCNNAAILLWLDMKKPAFLCGVEIQKEAAVLACTNMNRFATSDWSIEWQSIFDFEQSGFDVVLCNPPYFPLPACKSKEMLTSKEFARYETDLNIEALCACASKALRSGGKFACIHRPERLDALFEAMKKVRLQPSRLQIAYDAISFLPRAVLVEAVKEGSMQLRIEEPVFYDRSSRPKSGSVLFGPKRTEC